MRHLNKLITAATLATAGLAALGGATWAVNVIETSTRDAISLRLNEEGLGWARVQTDGLQVILTGTAATEAMRFRALSIAGEIAEQSRVIDRMSVADALTVEAPRFTVEVLRNGEDISLIGLMPMASGRQNLLGSIQGLSREIEVADMLDSADYPVPPGWNEAMAFGLRAVAMLAQSKVTITAGQVRIAAVAENREDQRRIESELRLATPAGVTAALEITSPRPVIAPFTLRFVIDEEGARFDACSADSDEARARILEAGLAAGASVRGGCTIGLGVPTAEWGAAAATGIGALAELGEGTITFSDGDVALVVPHDVDEATFDAVAARLDAALPEVFSVAATRLPAPVEDTGPAIAEFVATLTPEGHLTLRGLLADEQMRTAVESYSNARFGASSVQNAAELDEALPEGWARRVLSGLEALTELHNGVLIVREGSLELRGRSGNQDSSDVVSRVLSEKLGRGQVFRIAIDYDEELDPAAQLPTPERCEAQIADILAQRQITFGPGETRIEGDSVDVVDDIAAVLRECGELPFEIGGHTDSQGRAEMNLALSQQRAASVLDALVQRRVLVSQMTAVGYGQTRPIAENDTAEGREANRRIEFRLIRPEQEGPETDPLGRARDPELEATLEIVVETADSDTIRPQERPARD
jgi:OOP family OmpA-OmpF porin